MRYPDSSINAKSERRPAFRPALRVLAGHLSPSWLLFICSETKTRTRCRRYDCMIAAEVR
jgi:hypothetical protein